MKKIVCDFCNNENDFKDVSFEYMKFEGVKLPLWGMVSIQYYEVDLCAVCYKGVFAESMRDNLKRYLENKKDEVPRG